MKPLTFTLSINEANLIFRGLGQLPFSEVYELIGKLNEQANTQLRTGNDESTAKDLNSFIKPTN